MEVPVIHRVLPCLLVLIALTGCGRGVVYHPSTLPQEFIAPPVAAQNRIDLSRLAQAIGDSEVLYAGDVVGITVATGLETERPLEWKGRIAEDGSVNIPLVGLVPIAGLKLPFAEQIIKDTSIQRGLYVNPNVTLAIVARRSNTVTVVGEVSKPGSYQVPVTNSTVLAAITAAEGLTKDADNIIEVRQASTGPGGFEMANGGAPAGLGPDGQLVSFRPGQANGVMQPRATRIDLRQSSRLDPTMLQVGDGATVMVMKKPKRFVHVIGLVRKPDQIEIPDDQDLRLLDAIAKANGRTLEVADKVRVIRSVPGRSEPVVIEASIREAKQEASSNMMLTAGDVVSVEETPLTLVVGTIRDFVRFGFTSTVPGF